MAQGPSVYGIDTAPLNIQGINPAVIGQPLQYNPLNFTLPLQLKRMEQERKVNAANIAIREKELAFREKMLEYEMAADEWKLFKDNMNMFQNMLTGGGGGKKGGAPSYSDGVGSLLDDDLGIYALGKPAQKIKEQYNTAWRDALKGFDFEFTGDPRSQYQGAGNMWKNMLETGMDMANNPQATMLSILSQKDKEWTQNYKSADARPNDVANSTARALIQDKIAQINAGEEITEEQFYEMLDLYDQNDPSISKVILDDYRKNIKDRFKTTYSTKRAQEGVIPGTYETVESKWQGDLDSQLRDAVVGAVDNVLMDNVLIEEGLVLSTELEEYRRLKKAAADPNNPDIQKAQMELQQWLDNPMKLMKLKDAFRSDLQSQLTQGTEEDPIESVTAITGIPGYGRGSTRTSRDAYDAAREAFLKQFGQADKPYAGQAFDQLQDPDAALDYIIKRKKSLAEYEEYKDCYKTQSNFGKSPEEIAKICGQPVEVLTLEQYKSDLLDEYKGAYYDNNNSEVTDAVSADYRAKREGLSIPTDELIGTNTAGYIRVMDVESNRDATRVFGTEDNPTADINGKVTYGIVQFNGPPAYEVLTLYTNYADHKAEIDSIMTSDGKYKGANKQAQDENAKKLSVLLDTMKAELDANPETAGQFEQIQLQYANDKYFKPALSAATSALKGYNKPGTPLTDNGIIVQVPDGEGTRNIEIKYDHLMLIPGVELLLKSTAINHGGYADIYKRWGEKLSTLGKTPTYQDVINTLALAREDYINSLGYKKSREIWQLNGGRYKADAELARGHGKLWEASYLDNTGQYDQAFREKFYTSEDFELPEYLGKLENYGAGGPQKQVNTTVSTDGEAPAPPGANAGQRVLDNLTGGGTQPTAPTQKTPMDRVMELEEELSTTPEFDEEFGRPNPRYKIIKNELDKQRELSSEFMANDEEVSQFMITTSDEIKNMEPLQDISVKIPTISWGGTLNPFTKSWGYVSIRKSKNGEKYQITMKNGNRETFNSYKELMIALEQMYRNPQ